MLISLHIPFRAVQNLQFRRLVKMLNDEATMPGAMYIRNQLQNHVQFIEEHILVDLPAGVKISLAIDCWTSPHRLAFMAINGYFIDHDWRYREVLLSFEPLSGSHSGVNLARVLETVLHKYDIANRILAITTDNASNNGTLTRELQQALSSGNFKAQGGHISCFAHIIQLSLKELLGKIRIEATNEEVEKIWKDDSLIQIDDADGIGKTLAKVRFSSDLYNDPISTILMYVLLGPQACSLCQCEPSTSRIVPLYSRDITSSIAPYSGC